MLAFTQKLIYLRLHHPVFRRRQWFRDQSVKDGEIDDIAWFKFDGKYIQEEDWKGDYIKSFSIFINGRGMRSRTSLGVRVIDDSFYIIFNTSNDSIHCKLPSKEYAEDWTQILDTSQDKVIIQGDEGEIFQAGNTITVHGKSILLLHHFISKCEHLS